MSDDAKKLVEDVRVIVERIDVTLAENRENYPKWLELNRDCDEIHRKLLSLTPDQMSTLHDTPELLDLLCRVIEIRKKVETILGLGRPIAKA